MRAFLPLLLLAVSPVFAGDIYRCPDANGRIRFQDSPCPQGEQVEVVDQPLGWVAPDTSVLERGSAAKKTKRSRKPRKRKSARRAGGADACWKKRQQLERVSWQLRKGYKPSQGERLKQRRREYEAYLRRYCR